MKQSTYVKAGIIVIIVVVLVLAVTLPLLRYDSIQQLPIRVFVSANEEVGFDINTTKLDFGMMPPEATARKFVKVENQGTTAMDVRMYATGSVRPFMTIPSETTIAPGAEEEIAIGIRIPKNAASKQYEGTLWVLMR